MLVQFEESNAESEGIFHLEKSEIFKSRMDELRHEKSFLCMLAE